MTRQDGTAGNLHFHLFACVFSEAKKVSELHDEGYSPGMFEVTDDNQFFKDSCKTEELELCRGILQRFPKLFSLAWYRRWQRQVLGKEELFIGQIETKG